MTGLLQFISAKWFTEVRSLDVEKKKNSIQNWLRTYDTRKDVNRQVS